MVRPDTIRIRTTGDIGTNIKTFWYSVDTTTLSRGWTIFVISTLNWWMTAFLVSISYSRRLTVTLKRSSGIFTNRSKSAGRFRTEINQLATLCWISSVSRLATANLSMIFRRADRVHSARIVQQTSNLASMRVANFFLRTVAVTRAFHGDAGGLIVDDLSEESLFAGTTSVVISSGTFSVATAESQIASSSAFTLSEIVVNTLLIVIAVVVVLTPQFLHADIVRAKLEIGTAGVSSAGWLAESVDTKLVSDTFPGARTKCATNSCVTGRTYCALIVDFAVLNWGTSQIWISSSSSFAGTDSAVVLS